LPYCDRFGFAEQAINAIYESAEKPDTICGDILKKYTSNLFGLQKQDGLEENEMQIDGSPVDEIPLVDVSTVKTHELSKLCFLIGHVAMKQIVHLEAIESEWKRRKHMGICTFIDD
jgi:condensin complex subunit 1